VKVIVLTVSDDPEHVETAMKAGAVAYILKSVSPGELPAIVREAAKGTIYEPVGMTAEAEPAVVHGLTEREIVILQAVARGLPNRKIGSELWVTEQTVKFHLTNIYRKLGVSNRTEAARAAFRLGWALRRALERVLWGGGRGGRRGPPPPPRPCHTTRSLPPSTGIWQPVVREKTVSQSVVMTPATSRLRTSTPSRLFVR
jgi:DNA-binding CsgD family transcriptional regulator